MDYAERQGLFWPDKQQLVQPGLLLLNIINVLINTEFSFLKTVLLFKEFFVPYSS